MTSQSAKYRAKILTVAGARPQFIKIAAISKYLNNFGILEILVHTGQHYDANMSDVFFAELEIQAPEYNLGIGSGGHGEQTGRMLASIEEVLLKELPDLVLVYGDTNSTLAGALAAVKLHIPVAHIEAGLRSFNRRMPEEINRILTDHASDLLFAPSITALDNLNKEGIPESRVHFVGDVMYDIALLMGERAERESRILNTLALSTKGYILATIHRAENTDVMTRLKALIKGLIQIAKEIPVVFPVHPRTRKILDREFPKNRMPPGLKLIAPVGYLDMVMLEKHAHLIATDSGGVQKEAFFHKVPCLTLRDETEWIELVSLGWNRLASVKSEASVAGAIREALQAPLGLEQHPYGDGHAGSRVVEVLSRFLN